jgi:transcriptional regulator
MYLPPAFTETRTEVLHAVMREFSFGLLATAAGRAPQATHLPFLLDASRGPLGTLWGHVARANPHWRAFDGTAEALAIFQGPHAYVSPRWYTTGPAVPTWNYVAVHAYGTPRVIDDPAEVERRLDELVAQYEPAAPEGYRPDWTAGGFADRLAQGITAFEMPITRLEGKFKLSQNRSEADQSAVAVTLAASDAAASRSLAALMRREG